ncbi:MAG TPA: hypothetical protein VN830_07305 [Verrucomicrobiae bacterium]|nr:hypothetical protein [Verrucomicrobiae bacterium]
MMNRQRACLFHFPGCAWLMLAALLAMAGNASAQQPAGAGTGSQSLPDSPQPKQQPAASAPATESGKFIGYMTKRSLFFPDIAASPEPLSTGGKFKLFVNQSISPATIVVAAASAGFGQWRDSPPGYGQGAEGYGKRFGASMATGASTSFFGNFVGASLLHHDPRFFPQIDPTFWGSVKYSARRVFVTRSDSGKDVFDASGLFGPLAAEGLANTYLPDTERTGAKTMERYGTDLAWKFAANMFRNYWPKMFRDLGLNHLGVIPAPASSGRPPSK